MRHYIYTYHIYAYKYYIIYIYNIYNIYIIYIYIYIYIYKKIFAIYVCQKFQSFLLVPNTLLNRRTELIYKELKRADYQVYAQK